MSDDNATTIRLPRDEFSTRLRELQGSPEAVEKQSIVEVVDAYGNMTSWIVKTIRHDGQDTIFLQRNTSAGGDRWVLPPSVAAVIARHRDSAAMVNRRRAARTSAATRKAQGITPAFLKKAGA